MKLLVKITVLLFIFTSCCKDDDNIFDEKRNNIVGEWEVTETSRDIRSDTVYAESDRTFEITFNQDGTGIIETFVGIDAGFEWLHQFNPEKVVINGVRSGSILSLNSVQSYDVIENERNRQIWEYEVKPLDGVVDVYSHTWEMNRK